MLAGRVAPPWRIPVACLLPGRMLLIELAVEALDVFRWLERLEGGRVPKPEVLLMLLVDACDRSGFAGSAARSASVLRFVGGSGTGW